MRRNAHTAGTTLGRRRTVSVRTRTPPCTSGAAPPAPRSCTGTPPLRTAPPRATVAPPAARLAARREAHVHATRASVTRTAYARNTTHAAAPNRGLVACRTSKPGTAVSPSTTINTRGARTGGEGTPPTSSSALYSSTNSAHLLLQYGMSTYACVRTRVPTTPIAVRGNRTSVNSDIATCRGDSGGGADAAAAHAAPPRRSGTRRIP